MSQVPGEAVGVTEENFMSTTDALQERCFYGRILEAMDGEGRSLEIFVEKLSATEKRWTADFFNRCRYWPQGLSSGVFMNGEMDIELLDFLIEVYPTIIGNPGYLFSSYLGVSSKLFDYTCKWLQTDLTYEKYIDEFFVCETELITIIQDLSRSELAIIAQSLLDILYDVKKTNGTPRNLSSPSSFSREVSGNTQQAQSSPRDLNAPRYTSSLLSSSKQKMFSRVGLTLPPHALAGASPSNMICSSSSIGASPSNMISSASSSPRNSSSPSPRTSSLLNLIPKPSSRTINTIGVISSPRTKIAHHESPKNATTTDSSSSSSAIKSPSIFDNGAVITQVKFRVNNRNFLIGKDVGGSSYIRGWIFTPAGVLVGKLKGVGFTVSGPNQKVTNVDESNFQEKMVPLSDDEIASWVSHGKYYEAYVSE